jgi:hypothetical protein
VPIKADHRGGLHSVSSDAEGVEPVDRLSEPAGTRHESSGLVALPSVVRASLTSLLWATSIFRAPITSSSRAHFSLPRWLGGHGPTSFLSLLVGTHEVPTSLAVK